MEGTRRYNQGFVKMTAVTDGAIQWRYSPWSERPLKTWALLAVNLSVAAIVYFTFPEKGFTVLAILLMFGMTLSMLVPIRYEFNSKGVTVLFLGTRNFRPWPHYRNFYVHKDGIFLTSMKKPSGLDPFRGHFLYYGGNRDRVVDYARRHIKR
ncbi:hypothetical protein J7J84_03265 [bacterium]|nr:hypothetical protein [bacterium]